MDQAQLTNKLQEFLEKNNARIVAFPVFTDVGTVQAQAFIVPNEESPNEDTGKNESGGRGASEENLKPERPQPSNESGN